MLKLLRRYYFISIENDLSCNILLLKYFISRRWKENQCFCLHFQSGTLESHKDILGISVSLSFTLLNLNFNLFYFVEFELFYVIVWVLIYWNEKKTSNDKYLLFMNFPLFTYQQFLFPATLRKKNFEFVSEWKSLKEIFLCQMFAPFLQQKYGN